MRIQKLFLLGISVFVLFPMAVYGAPVSPAVVSGVSAASVGLPNQVGIAAAVRGVVKVGKSGQVGEVVSSGKPIFLGDEVSTDADSNLQILLLDQTIFTIGPNSAIVIDKFVYDPATHDGEVKAKVVKGVFRFVTGKIGQKKPQQMEVALPAGTIGIRGTIVAGQTGGGNSLVVLLGPGDNNNTGARQGSFDLNSGGQSQTVNKSGFGSTINGDGPPAPPFQVPQAQLDGITSALGPPPASSGDQDSGGGGQGGSGGEDSPTGEGGESPTAQAGQDTADAGTFAGDQNSLGNIFGDLGDETSKVSQEGTDDFFKYLDGLKCDVCTTFDELDDLAAQVNMVQFYKIMSFNIYDSNTDTVIGSALFQMDIDLSFANRTVGGGNSKVIGTFNSGALNGQTFQFFLDAGSANHFSDFGSGEEHAIFSFENISNSSSIMPCPGGGCSKADVTVSLYDSGSSIAHEADVDVEIFNSNSDSVAYGYDTASGRTNGTS